MPRIAYTLTALVSALLLSACVTGSSIVTGPILAETSPETVKLYLEPPKEYTSLGLVESKSVIGITGQQDMDMAIDDIKKRAAKMGANGVLLKNANTESGGNSGTFYSSTGGTGFFTGGYANAATVSGIAIRVQ